MQVFDGKVHDLLIVHLLENPAARVIFCEPSAAHIIAYGGVSGKETTCGRAFDVPYQPQSVLIGKESERSSHL